MIATAAETNPSCFSPTPLVDVHRTLIPTYLRIVSIAFMPLLRLPTDHSCSQGTWVTTGQTPNSVASSSAEIMLSPLGRRRSCLRTNSPRPSATMTWTMLQETGPKERPNSRRSAERSKLVHIGFLAQPPHLRRPSRTRLWHRGPLMTRGYHSCLKKK